MVAARDAGRVPNLQLILPVVELRLTNLVGNRETGRINFHVVFSDEVSADEIENFFLRQLNVSLKLSTTQSWNGCLGTKQGLEQLGAKMKAVTPDGVRQAMSDLRAGFASAAVPPEKLREILEQSVFDGRFLTAIGLGEWREMRWQGAGAAQKRDAIESPDFIFTATPTVAEYQRHRERLRADSVNERLVHASDAHYYAAEREPNRLGQTLCWVKADLTFQGLRRALRRFDERVFTGVVPPKLERVRNNRRHYLKRLQVRRKTDSTLTETWFDTDIQFNHDMVAVIGNQGSGKSALTDIIALCGATRASAFSFLNEQKFRDKQKRAAHFEATLSWEEGEPVTVCLADSAPASSVERVRYVPQGFFDSVTNETAVTERGQFYSEIKKAIFSHVLPSDRLECTSFDELMEHHTVATGRDLAELRKQLRETNRRIAMLEKECAPRVLEELDARIARRREEITQLEQSPPAEVTPPADRGAASVEIDHNLEQQGSLREQSAQAEAERARLKRQRSVLSTAIQSIQGAERSARHSISTIQRQLDDAGVTANVGAALTITVNYGTLTTDLETMDREIARIDALLDVAQDSSLSRQLEELVARRAALEQESEASESAYQAYRTSVAQWHDQLEHLRGSEASPSVESLAGLMRRRNGLTVDLPRTLANLQAERRAACKAIHAGIALLASEHERIARPVRQHIATERLTADHYDIAFDVRIGENGLADRLFALVAQTSGTFAQRQPGRDRLRALITEAEFTTSDGAAAFADALLDRLKQDHRRDPPEAVALGECLKQGATVEQVYDLIYGLEYLGPVFELGLNGKPLKQLSPGERGILLLVFYLVVDRGDEPLIIDQPEGNLNNQSIVKHLVPVFKAAKERRQIVIVTHNPNIAVVCDAEQIIHCEMDQGGSYRVRYSTGALENPKFNNLSLDLLEGTADALGARVHTYDAMARNGRG